MSRERSNYDYADEHTALSDLNLLGLLSATGSEWTSVISKEFQALSPHSPNKEKSISTRNWILLGTLSGLLLISAATLTQAGLNSPASQSVKTAIAR